MERKKFSIGKFVKILLVLLVIFLVGSFLSKRKPADFQDVSPERKINWRIPELPDGFNWVENDANEEDVKDSRIMLDDRFTNKGSENMSFSEILAPGKIYHTSLTSKESSYSGDTGSSIDKILKGTMESTGWSSSTRYKDYLVSGMAAGGIRGSISGYVRIEQGLVRTIVYGYRYDGNWISSGYEPAHLECPCTLVMTIFISEPVALENYIPFKISEITN